MKVTEILTEKWSQKYKSSINCSHPRGFSQKAHCAGKKKHNESVEMEMVCEDCGMCETHGSLNEIAKGAKDANGVTKCWPGKHAEGTKKGKNGGQVRNCVPNESIEEEAKHGLYYNVNKRKKAGTSRDADSPKAPTAQAWKDAAKTAKNESIVEGEVSTSNLRTMYDLANMVKNYTSPEGQESLNQLLKIIKWYMNQADQGMAEGFNGEYDDEAGMADNNLETLRRSVEGIDNVINAGDNLPEWCQEKIAVAKSMLVTVWDYMKSEEEIGDPEIAEMYEAMESFAEEVANNTQTSVDAVWETFEAMDDHALFETAAWRRSAGKSKKGGLNAKGVASYRRENPGSKLQMAVTTKPSKLKAGSKAAKRRKSFCARMGGVKGPMKKPNGKPTRKALALRKWNC
jgi:hypothetical protein